MALLTYLRHICTLENIPAERVMFESKIVDLLGQILAAEVDDDILYFMKLEACWILTNLCMNNSLECC
jgi:hypothetical protein